MSYTVGNWTIDALYQDSISTPKTLSIPDLDYADDFSESLPSKGRVPASKNAQEKTFSNRTGASVFAPEQAIYGRQAMANIYANVEVDVSQQLPQKGGHRAYCTTYVFYRATNAVSGLEYIVPFKTSISLDVPDASFIPQALVEEVMKRNVSRLYGTGSTNGDMVANMLRGDIDPTR